MVKWYRVPEWVWTVNDAASGKKARAWVYLLGSWHAGNDPGIREVMRATGYGGGMTTALVREVARWAHDAGARLPEQYIDSTGTVPKSSKPQVTPPIDADESSAGTVDRFYGNDSRARVPSETRRDETRRDHHTDIPPADADDPTPTTTPEADREPEPTSTTATDARPDAGSEAHGVRRGAERGEQAPTAGQPPTGDPRAEPHPGRAGPSVSRERGVPADVHAAMLRCIEEVRQTTVNPERTATDRKSLASLWKAIGKPDAATFEQEFRIVARWARESEDKAAAGDIRGIGWKDNQGTDRHRDIATLCRQERWAFRLELARKWSASMGATSTSEPMDWTESDDGRRLAQKRINGAPEIVGSTKRMTFLARRTFNQIGGIKAWGGRPVSPEWIVAWRKEWPASVDAWERQQQQAGAAK